MTKSLLFVLFFAALLGGCGKAANRERVKNGEGFQEYGKPGPGKGEACYVGAANSKHSCAEAMVGDKESIKTLNSYCESFEGQRGSGTCKTQGHIATCRYMKSALNIKLRFYGQSFEEARLACDQEGGQIFSAY